MIDIGRVRNNDIRVRRRSTDDCRNVLRVGNKRILSRTAVRSGRRRVVRMSE